MPTTPKLVRELTKRQHKGPLHGRNVAKGKKVKTTKDKMPSVDPVNNRRRGRKATI